MKKCGLMLIFLLLVVSAFSQVPSANSDYFSTCAVDTIEVGKHSIGLRLKKNDDTIAIQKYVESSVIDTNFFCVMHRGDNSVPNSDVLKEQSDFFATAAQNCHSYALELYFRENKYEGLDWFNSRTSIQPQYYRRILDNQFQQVREYCVRKSTYLEPVELLNNNVLLVFYDEDNEIIHSAYFRNGIFYTKNGTLKARQVSKISELLSAYWTTKYVREYIRKDGADRFRILSYPYF